MAPSRNKQGPKRATSFENEVAQPELDQFDLSCVFVAVFSKFKHEILKNTLHMKW